jgi:hypothetical protein
MATQVKLGRNDPCACGSGKKFKNCCDGKSPAIRMNTILMAALVLVLIGGLAAAVISFRESSSAIAMPGQVWSPEHGHFH